MVHDPSPCVGAPLREGGGLLTRTNTLARAGSGESCISIQDNVIKIQDNVIKMFNKLGRQRSRQRIAGGVPGGGICLDPNMGSPPASLSDAARLLILPPVHYYAVAGLCVRMGIASGTLPAGTPISGSPVLQLATCKCGSVDLCISLLFAAEDIVIRRS